MALSLVDVGTTANDGTGDPLRTAFQTVNTALTALDPFGSNPLTAAELGQLQNIGTSTISATQWGYLGALDQGLTTTSSPTFTKISFTGNPIGGEAKVVADDAVGSWTPPRAGGFAMITPFSSATYPNQAGAAIVYFDSGTSLAIALSSALAGVSTSVDVVTTDLTGTSGTDGKLTISVFGSVLKIENRLGASYTVHVTFL